MERGRVLFENNGYFIQFKQKKTKGVEMMPISEQAFNLMGEQKAQTNQVFEGLIYSAYSNKHLNKWIEAAGDPKELPFIVLDIHLPLYS